MSSFFRSAFTSSATPAAKKDECSVCLAVVSPGDAFTDPSGCGHLLHLHCFMTTHQNMHSVCPTCRAPFKITAGAPSPPAVAAPTMPAVSTPIPPPMPRSRYMSSAVVPPEEPLVSVSDRKGDVGDAAPAVLSSSDSDPTIEVVLTPEVSAAAAGKECRMFVNVSTISQDTEVTEKSRVGVDLVMVLDKSGSMGGEKERLLRNAVEFVIGELDERDRLCTVAFDNRAHYEHGFIGMGREGREKALTHARGHGLRASGGTDIYDGLKKGVAVLNARKIPNAVTTLFLLTDGIDDRNLSEKLALARHARSNGWFMFIFAFGADHNASHLNAIAEAADSSYIFIDNVATVREAFGGAIGSQQGVAGKLLNLSIQAADAGVVIHRAVAGQYASNVSEDKRMAIVTYPNLLVGEQRDCCVEVTVPAVALEADRTVLLNATLTYTPANAENLSMTTNDMTIISPPCAIERPMTIETALVRNDIVDSQMNRLNGIDVIERATALADANNLDGARALVTGAKAEMLASVSAAHPSTQAMIAELTECMGRLQTTREWESIGRSEQVESCNIHKGQRGVYAKKSRYNTSADSSAAMYSSSRSKACQSKASFF